MKEIRRLSLHLVLLVIAATAAFIESRPKEAQDTPLQPGEVEVWGGQAADVKSVAWETPRKIIELTVKQDKLGDYYLGDIKPGPGEPEEEADAGAADAGKKPPKKPPQKPIEPSKFVSVQVGEQLMKKLAPLRAKRMVGEIPKEREASFGLDKPKGTLRIKVNDTEHVLVVGGDTPGRGGQYARHEQTKIVYVLDASIVRDLEGGSGRLAERAAHKWKITEVHQAQLSGGGKQKKVVRGEAGGKQFWANADTPDEPNETAGNWLQKLERLRPEEFIEKLPEGAELVCRVEYRSKTDDLGFIELYKGKHNGQDSYFITSEQLRYYSTVSKPVADPVADDLRSVLNLEDEAKDDDQADAGAGGGEPGDDQAKSDAGAKPEPKGAALPDEKKPPPPKEPPPKKPPPEKPPLSPEEP